MNELQKVINNQIKILEELQSKSETFTTKILLSQNIKSLVDTAINIEKNTKSI